MLIPFDKIRQDFLSLKGESPRLSPIYEEGEDSAVLTVEDQLKASLIPAAVKATLETEPIYLDEVEEIYPEIEWDDRGIGKIRLPQDYLALVEIWMPDWAEGVTRPEPKESLRNDLRGNAPKWMTCPERPVVVEGRDRKGPFLRIYGSSPIYDEPEQLRYIPRPRFEDSYLRISGAAYPTMLQFIMHNA